MTIAESMLPEFDREMESTRKMLDRLPDASFDFVPHPKSYPLGRLAGHLVGILDWMVTVLEEGEFDIDPPEGEPSEPPEPATRQEALELFDESVARARRALVGTSDEEMFAAWRLESGGRTLVEMPRVAALRSTILNHMIHHRGQLGVYLRLLDVPLPAIYGPSADEAS